MKSRRTQRLKRRVSRKNIRRTKRSRRSRRTKRSRSRRSRRMRGGTEEAGGTKKGKGRTGHHKVVLSDGTVYEGEWKDGKRHGHGSQNYPNRGGPGEYTYDGHWENDQRHGRGQLTYPHGDIEKGRWNRDWFDRRSA